MAHPAVAEAAVIAVPDDRWGERPLAVRRAPRRREPRTRSSCVSTSRSEFAKWQLPDRFEFVAAIPRTATGKFKKSDAARAIHRMIQWS